MKKPLRRQSFEKARNIETTKNPKHNGEQHPGGVRTKTICKEPALENGGNLCRNHCTGGKHGKHQETGGNRWDNEDIAGRKSGKTFEKASQLETTKNPKLEGGQRPVGFGPRQLHNQGTNVGKCGKTQGKRRTPSENDELVGRKPWKDPYENVGQGEEKRHAGEKAKLWKG